VISVTKVSPKRNETSLRSLLVENAFVKIIGHPYVEEEILLAILAHKDIYQNIENGSKYIFFVKNLKLIKMICRKF